MMKQSTSSSMMKQSTSSSTSMKKSILPPTIVKQSIPRSQRSVRVSGYTIPPASSRMHFEDEEAIEDTQHPEERNEIKEIQKMSKIETTRVCVWKAVVLVVILVTAELVTAGTYRVLKDDEESSYSNAYERFANTVKDGIEFRFSNLQASLGGMSNAIAGAAEAQGETFPFVTLDDFEVRGQAVRSQTGIEIFSYSPYVDPSQVADYVNYTQENAAQWIALSREAVLKANEGTLSNSNYQDGPTAPCIWWTDDSDDFACRTKPFKPMEHFVPVWQHSPPLFDNMFINSEWTQSPVNLATTQAMEALRQSVMSPVTNVSWFESFAVSEAEHNKFHSRLVDWKNFGDDAFVLPHIIVTVPVFSEVNDPTSTLVGQLQANLAWDYYLVGLLPEGVEGITVVLENSCNQTYSYDLDGNSAYYRGDADTHENKYSDKRKLVPFYEFSDLATAEGTQGHCVYTFSIYPTQGFEDEYRTNIPLILSLTVGTTFFIMIISFFMYDWYVHTRNRKIMGQAARATGVVSSMFPGPIRDQLLKPKDDELNAFNLKGAKAYKGNFTNASQLELKKSSFYARENQTIADFFPETTIMFADISGFTAWSSSREPAQVFQLLETLYEAFDELAKQRRVFKVETVGDCYVAAAGLPEARKDHATVMARFAKDIVYKMRSLLPRLEIMLGPDTGDLSMRVGLHSGAVTAGVLRGERARFQLFGDTMNTASRMESTSRPGMIQVSHDTAELLKAVGKHSWLTQRSDSVEAKGKGKMTTYWLNVASSRDDSINHSFHSQSHSSFLDGVSGDAQGPPTMIQTYPGREEDVAKTDRLIGWNVEILLRLLKKIHAYRDLDRTEEDSMASATDTLSTTSMTVTSGNGTPLDEVKEVIHMPSFQEKGSICDPDTIELGSEVGRELREFIRTVAALYRDNAFHSFEHASHVAMATLKLLKRVVNPKIEHAKPDTRDPDASALHDYTYGITSDPLTQFACVFSAVIHDLDHPGVPNSQLALENPELAQIYQRSVAEQNSLDLAWKLFMGGEYQSLRKALCATPRELKRFRQLVVNLVMATDIMDKDLRGFRDARWEKAFGLSADVDEPEKEKVDRKATIVIEHLIQASDVAHTMQHWHIYRKWNARLFNEMYEAYLNGRSSIDPSINWYEGEMGFFDFYIIPLAKKLAECGVFGVTSSEYLDYAMRNRREWEDRGRDCVAAMLEEAKALQEQKLKRAAAMNEHGNLDDEITEFAE